jgi:RimJ/RimL family protein N-acetyltransferase
VTVPDRYPIVTERLLLRPKTPDDLDSMFALYEDPAVAVWLGWGTGEEVDRAEAQRRLERHIEHQRKHGFSMWAVVERASGDVVGDCGLQHLDEVPGVEVGWGFLSSRWGRGYATEAARAALAFGFAELDLQLIVALIRPENARSRKVAEHLGMVEDGHGTYHGVEHVRYVLVRPEPDGAY